MSKIEWTDITWNPVVGCTKVSEGCRHCYAERMSARLAAMADADFWKDRDPGRKHHYQDVVQYRAAKPLPQWNNQVRCIDDALTDPLHWRKPRRVFVNSMSDLFHEDVPDAFICEVWNVMRACPQHTYQLLTKRPERMADLVPRLRFDGTRSGWVYLTDRAENIHDGYALGHGVNGCTGLPNVMLGTSVEDQATADARIPHLLRCPAAVRFLSVEPLLGAVDFRKVPGFNRVGMDVRNWWVIVGGESGPDARPMHPDWVRSIRDKCQAAGVPFFFKQWGAWKPICEFEDGEVDRKSTQEEPSRWHPEGRTIHPWPDHTFGLDSHKDGPIHTMFRVGKKAAGRLLDGREHNDMPALPGQAVT